jgi:V/A-type H+-transporting ATPase subunit D
MGRLWVLNRLDLAERGVMLLDQKLNLLTALQEELQRRAELSRHDWQHACREADMWGLRAVLLGGQQALDLAVATAPASVTVQWAITAGVRYPDVAACVLPPEDDPAVIYRRLCRPRGRIERPLWPRPNALQRNRLREPWSRRSTRPDCGCAP